MGGGKFNTRGNPAIDYHPTQGGVEIFLVASCYRNRDKLLLGEPLGKYADFTVTFYYIFSIVVSPAITKISLIVIRRNKLI